MNKPEANKSYMLVGGSNVKSIAAGNTWAESEVKSEDELATRHSDGLIESAPEMLELLKAILAEVRPEISRVNEAAGRTIFNPVATETIDMAKELIAKVEGGK